MTTLQIDVPRQSLEAFCRKWQVRELALFGSVLRDDFRPDSDIDVLVSFASDAHWTLWQLIEAEGELARLFGRRVDLVEKKNVVNPFRRHHILNNKMDIYSAGS